MVQLPAAVADAVAMNPPSGWIESDVQVVVGAEAPVVTTLSGKVELSTDSTPGGAILMYPAAFAVYVMLFMVKVPVLADAVSATVAHTVVVPLAQYEKESVVVPGLGV